jgi:hypothetical protein
MDKQKSRLISLRGQILFYNKYIQQKGLLDNKLQDILSDVFFRYIHHWEIINDRGKIKLIVCIKEFYKNGYNDRYDKIFNIIGINNINETNKLLLQKCICYEYKYENVIDKNLDKKESCVDYYFESDDSYDSFISSDSYDSFISSDSFDSDELLSSLSSIPLSIPLSIPSSIPSSIASSSSQTIN